MMDTTIDDIIRDTGIDISNMVTGEFIYTTYNFMDIWIEKTNHGYIAGVNDTVIAES